MVSPGDREELLYALSSMGVELPPKTKLSVKSLDKKLRKALEASQELKDVLKEEGSVDASKLNEWTSSLFENIDRASYEEVTRNSRALQQTGAERSPGRNVNPFYDLRQTLMEIGLGYDRGVKTSLILDEDVTHSIVIRVSAIF